MTEIWRQPSPRESLSLACADQQPTISRIEGGVRIEVTGSQTFIVELSHADCQRIAMLIE